MSFKARIYVIVAVLMTVALAIGGIGLYALGSINDAVKKETDFAYRVSTIKDLRSDIQDVLLGVRDIVLTEDTDTMKEEKAVLDKVIAEDIDPTFASYPVLPQDAERWNNLRQLWEKHKEIVQRIYANTLANSRYIATRLSVDDGFRYWMDYEPPLRKLLAAARAVDSPEGRALANSTSDALEAFFSLQLREKLAIMAASPDRRRQEKEMGAKELARYSANLSAIEKICFNPAAGEDELKALNDRFNEANKVKIAFNDDGTLTVRMPDIQAPRNFINPAVADASRIYWDEVKRRKTLPN